jgi:hemerythrin superfamily protein
MKPVLTTFLPRATNMIRLDHTHVLATFHQYRTSDRPSVKRGLADTICIALEVHAQLEEEIFYPAIRAVTDNESIRKSVPEHDEMRRLITVLRNKAADEVDFDDTVMELMRDVLHHVADEETILLPEAERLLAKDLEVLGVQMTRRRIELVGPRVLDIASSMVRSISPSTAMVGLLATAAALFLFARRATQPRHRH